MKVLITGGGTGGHVSPALAVVDALRADGVTELLYVGSRDGIEARLAVEAGVPFVGVATGKLRRASHPLKMLNTRNLRDVARVPLGAVQAWRAVRSFGPDVVLSTGGYVCVPTVLAAALCRVPVVTHEQTATIGLANRIAGRFARTIALTVPSSADVLSAKLKLKSVVTGNPLRAQLFEGSVRNAARFGFAESDAALPGVYVTGGAQGAHVINEAIAEAAPDLLRHARVLHQCGTNDLESLREHQASLPPELGARWQLRAFVERDEIGDAWAFADLVVARA